MAIKGIRANQVVLINKSEGQRVCPVVTQIPEQGLPATKNYIVAPGVNPPADRAAFEKACENAKFKSWVEDGYVYELKGDVNEWTDDHAQAMMNRTSDIEGLRWWLKQCKLPKIAAKLEAMIESFESMYKQVKKSG